MERDSYFQYEMEHRKSLFERQSMLMSLMLKMIALAALFFLLLSASKPIEGILIQYERILAAEASGMERLPQLKKQIETLEKQMAALSTSSIESRLNKIEKAIQTGDLSIDDIGQFRGQYT